ncbi:PucR family transcriptional regulator ligand-binding domain-containing protein [Streptomyces sp. NPDC058272]|uniref:PucR family transcriptional regulator ligand-binding domain-containing protein n=1 Tax=Streptomyces sp. NPDC058272 TaxID=3346415 RepID=UPI0036EE36F5
MPDTSAPPVRPVPPTPPVPLSALLAREDLGLRRIAGPSDPDTVIHWAHTSEMADPYPYLLGGELLLTAGVHIPEAAGSGTYFDDYVSRIVAAGGAALGFGLAPVHDTVPRALAEACDTYGLPLLEVPPQTTFSGVARAVWQLMAQARLAELRRVTEAQQSLAAAAARPDPVPAVLRQLAQRVGGRAVLYGPDGAELAEAGRMPWPNGTGTPTPTGQPPAGQQPAAPSATGQRPAAPSPAAPSPTGQSPTGQRPAGQAPVAPSPAGQTPATQHPAGPSPTGPSPARQSPTGQPAAGQAPVATAPAGQTPATQHPVAQPPVMQALAELARVVRPGDAQGPTPSSATDSVGGTHLAAYALGSGQGFVLGVAAPRRDPGDHTIASVAAVLLSLLTGEQQSGSGAARSAALVRLLLGAAPEDVAPLLGGERWIVVHARPAGDGPAPDAVSASALGAALGSVLVDAGGDVVRVLVSGEREPTAQPGWTCGVSAAVGPHEWAAADTQAARALARARATRAALVRHGERPALADLVPPADAEAHARALLAPIAATPALTETLRTWLSLHGSWDRTAVALSVHRNTVRQRIARCATLLGADLDDADVRMELWFALREG